MTFGVLHRPAERTQAASRLVATDAQNRDVYLRAGRIQHARPDEHGKKLSGARELVHPCRQYSAADIVTCCVILEKIIAIKLRNQLFDSRKSLVLCPAVEMRKHSD